MKMLAMLMLAMKMLTGKSAMSKPLLHSAGRSSVTARVREQLHAPLVLAAVRVAAERALVVEEARRQCKREVEQRVEVVVGVADSEF